MNGCLALVMRAVPLLLICMLAACRSVEPRAAASSYGCMKTVRDEVRAQHANAGDKALHCMVSAQIARRCSVAEAYLAGIGKELGDVFAAHRDAQWADWQADRAGIACGKQGADIARCCAD